MALQPTLILTKDQIEFYRTEGYLKLENLMPTEEIERMKVIYDRLFESQAGRASGDFFDLAGDDADSKKPKKTAQMMNPSKYAPELQGEWQYKVNAAAIAKQLQGGQSYFRQDLAICKPAKSAAPTLWHQDSAYNDAKFDYENLNIWIPLQAVNENNGCMSFVPRSHVSKEILKHHRPDPKIEGIECLEVDLKKAVPMHLPAGGCTVHHARLLHYASGNHSDGPRRAFILEYEVPPVKRAVAHHFSWNDNRQTARSKKFNKLSTRVGNKLRKLMGAK